MTNAVHDEGFSGESIVSPSNFNEPQAEQTIIWNIRHDDTVVMVDGFQEPSSPNPDDSSKADCDQTVALPVANPTEADSPSSSASQSQEMGAGNEFNPIAGPLDDAYFRSEAGLSELFVTLNKGNLIYCQDLGDWHHWDGKRWKRDNTHKSLQLAKKTLKHVMKRLQSGAMNSETVKRVGFLLRSETATKFESILKLAKPDLAITADKFDENPYLLNVQNGTLDLSTGRLYKHDQLNYQTKIANTVYNPNSECAGFKRFLKTIFDGDIKLIAFLQKVLGYSLTGLTSEQCWFLLYGTGQNGKSTLVNIIRNILGDYSAYTPANTFQLSYGERIRNDLARLKGARFICASEPDKTRKLDTELLKSFTGGEAVTCRYLRKEFFEYYPSGKLFISANHYPSVSASDFGFWRRIRIIPFNVTIPKELRQRDFESRFSVEHPGILRWLVDGCLRWNTDGLEAPDTVNDAIATYKDSMDSLSDFLASPEIEIGEDKSVSKTQLYSSYVQWLKNQGITQPVNQEEFNRTLMGKGFKQKQVGARRVRSWIGIAVNVSHT